MTQLSHEENVRQIIVKDDQGKALLDNPVIIGMVGIIIASWLTALGVIGAFITNFTIVVERFTKELFFLKTSIILYNSFVFYGYYY